VNGEQNTSDRSRPVARNERQQDEARDGRGGVSTITRAAAGPRTGGRQRPAAVPRSAPEQGQGQPRRSPAAVPGQADGLPRNAQAAPGAPPKPSAAPKQGSAPKRGSAPKQSAPAKPNAAAAPGARPGQRPALAGNHRLPFVLLLCGLLGGALVSALVISTTLAEGAFQISNLQNSTTAQAKQLQSLEEEVAQAQSSQQIASRAAKLGMVGVGELRFVDLKTGKTTTDADPNFVGSIPGYTP
jgi:hypothetical protein